MTLKYYMLDLWCLLAADRFNFRQFTVMTLKLIRYFHMGAAATLVLSLLLPPKSDTTNCHQSLLGHTELCCTSQGHR